LLGNREHGGTITVSKSGLRENRGTTAQHLPELGHRENRGITALAGVGAPKHKRTDGVKTKMFTYAVNLINRTW